MYILEGSILPLVCLLHARIRTFNTLNLRLALPTMRDRHDLQRRAVLRISIRLLLNLNVPRWDGRSQVPLLDFLHLLSMVKTTSDAWDGAACEVVSFC